MKIYYMGRCTGKTTLMIEESNRTGYPIICPNVAIAACIKSQAKRIKLKIPEPISILRIIDKRADGVKARHVLIDEAQACLEAIISNRMNCHIDAMTVGKQEDETKQESISESQGKTLNGKTIQTPYDFCPKACICFDPRIKTVFLNEEPEILSFRLHCERENVCDKKPKEKRS